MAQPQVAKITYNHETIKNWARDRGGVPAILKKETDDPTVMLRIHFPGSEANEAKKATWEELFRFLDKENISFLYQDRTPEGEMSRYYKFICR